MSDNVIWVLSFSALCAALGVLTAFVNLQSSRAAYKKAHENGKNELFLKLRTKFQAIRQNIDSRCLSKTPPPLSDSDKKSLEAYWYNAFDEWFITNKLSSEYRDLWDDYFSDAIKWTLALPAPVAVLVDMLEHNASFGNQANSDFRTVLNDLNQAIPEADRQVPRF